MANNEPLYNYLDRLDTDDKESFVEDLIWLFRGKWEASGAGNIYVDGKIYITCLDERACNILVSLANAIISRGDEIHY